MPRHSETKHLPYSPEQLFELVADVARYDEFLRENIVGTDRSEIIRRRSVLALPCADSLFSSEPLARRIEAALTPRVLCEVARAHAAGRRLYIGTTNLDTGKLVIWDMGAIASRGTAEAFSLYRDVVLASSSIPGAFPPLRLIDKFRLGLTILRASRLHDWKKLERIPVVDWLRRWSGRRTLEKIWLPLLRAKLGESYRIASAAFIWAIIARMYAARRSGLKKEMFGYAPGGYAEVLRRFAESLRSKGVDIRTNCKVRKVAPVAGDQVEV